MELLLLEDEQTIETLATHTSEKAFTDGIRSQGVIRGLENLDPTRLRNTGEVRTKLAIGITDEVLRSFAIGGGFPQLLCYPRIARRPRHAHMDHFAWVQFDDEEGKERPEKQVGNWEEVTGPDLLSMIVKEGRPVLPT